MARRHIARRHIAWPHTARPHIAIKTTQGREYTFAPSFPTTDVVEVKLVADNRNESHNGLYVNAVSTLGGKDGFEHIGVFSSLSETEPTSTDGLPPQFRIHDDFRLGRKTVYSSETQLMDIQTVTTCSLNDQCTGIKISHLNGFEEYLGSWYENMPGMCVQIKVYQSDCRLGLRFTYVDSQHTGLEAYSTIVHRVEPVRPEWTNIDAPDGTLDIPYGGTFKWLFSSNMGKIVLPDSDYWPYCGIVRD
ncbi:hypothetical protein FE257_002079 [Aspergillus nanangensis]|uniref:Uncharacterized protein n=1 Tax=Aspergillus nanangensis TaxID=2582783 RepID=A0AAD4GWV7_ASPNN|nr:hypothetical protein FE257_002079 [Aspergillus nanangensis]